MTVEEIKLELKNSEKFLEKIEKESEIELDKKIEMMYDYIEELENELYNKENSIEYAIMNW